MSSMRYTRRRLLQFASCSTLAVAGSRLLSSPRPAAATTLRRLSSTSRALLEPAQGAYFGVNLDWTNDSAAAFARRLGVQPSVYVQFAPIPLAGQDAQYVDEFVAQVAERQALGVLTLQPNDGLATVTADVAQTVAQRAAGYNAQGVPLLIRFAHEMNGSWYPWSQQPTAYVRAFRLLADAVHAAAPQTAMLWAPNYGSGYPFTGGQYALPATDPDFALLDTNRDGVLDQRDDMYAPYYPGDDAVDWVGMSLYHWGDRYPWGKNIVPEPGKFLAQLTGSYNGAGGDDRTIPNFYRDYVTGHGKPLAIVETAAFFNTAAAGDAELTIKQQWWQQIFSAEVTRSYPGIKMINWFDWRKYESEVQSVVDWSVSRTPSIRDAFVADLPRDWLRYAPIGATP